MPPSRPSARRCGLHRQRIRQPTRAPMVFSSIRRPPSEVHVTPRLRQSVATITHCVLERRLSTILASCIGPELGPKIALITGGAAKGEWHEMVFLVGGQVRARW